MVSYTIDESTIGYINREGTEYAVKIYFYVEFIKDDGTSSGYQYYECDWNDNSLYEDNMLSVYDQLQITVEEYNTRV